MAIPSGFASDKDIGLRLRPSGGCAGPWQRMRQEGRGGIDWDLTPASDLIFLLSDAAEPKLDEGSSPSPSPDNIITPTRSPDAPRHKSDLGNFDKLWAFLGQPLDLPPPEVPPLAEDYTRPDVDNETELHLTVGKGVRWRDDAEGGELADVEEAATLSGLTKQQRKKLRRKERKAAHDEKGHRLKLSTSSSDNESEVEPQTPKHFVDRREILHQFIHGSVKTPDGGSPAASKNSTGRAVLPIDVAAWPVAAPHLSNPFPKYRSNPTGQTSIVAAAAKKERLMRKLKERFIDDQPFLTSMSMRTFTSRDNTGLKEGIHVFVDASNIMIGFHDSIKLSLGLPIHSRLRRQALSFDRLSLILERGRPTSKRILVGSDAIDAVEEAKSIGYEINILNRVLKAKELTPRQKKFSSRTNGSNASATVNGTSGGSGSETTAAKEKWVEQAVDEILHLKILESVIDAQEPSTMVLATGDAAEAEYSQGFLRMAERALEKGWKVELVSFRKNMSGMYKRKEFRTRWKGRFTVVELDDYLEELQGS
ncbi:MAG: hypothetical protein Q9216_004472 [Gyalolechia sp. 2 TL-2023]